ncbi:hypothetical protein OIV19_18390 [Brucella sp. HL-2]|nr:hypothetical protein [Brucella sp. HL-2]MCV9909573.1 hypothetical protein [Brucella sp. HL-2]
MNVFLIIFALLCINAAYRLWRKGAPAREAQILAEANAELRAYFPNVRLEDITPEMRRECAVAFRSRVNRTSAYYTYKPASAGDPLVNHTISGGRIVGHSGRVVCENINDLSGPERANLMESLRTGTI